MTRSCSRLILVLIVLVAASTLWPGCSRRDVDFRAESAIDTVRAAFQGHRSGIMVEVPGRVVRILSDDNQGSRHQRFIVELDGSHTILVSHNIDLARRVPVDEGDSVLVRGQYEWNPQGGVLHWTHQDPGGTRPGGWIRHRDAVYH